MTNSHETGQGRHPTFQQYVTVATFLFIITIIEFLIIYKPLFPVTRLDALEPVKIPFLGILSTIKFAAVIMFYMHLKFDHKLFSVVFLAGLALALAVAIAVLGLSAALGGDPRAYAEENRVYYDKQAAGEARELAAAAKELAPPPTIIAAAVTQPPAVEDGKATAAPVAPPPASGSGNAELVAQGQALFTGKGACLACHAIEGIAAGLVGPDLSRIGSDAATRNTPQTAREYIAQSIRQPETFVATGVERAIPGLMTSAITASLSDAEVDALVEFLLAQK